MSCKLLKFSADWCANCDNQDEMLEEFDAVPVESIDVDEDHETANKYSVRSLPTLVLIDEGELVERWVGVTSLDEIESAVENVK